SAGEGGTSAPSPVVAPPRRTSSVRWMDLLIGIVAVASLVVGLFSIYVTIDGRITKVKEDADQNFHSVKDFSKDGLGRLERTVDAVCENLREVEETQFGAR